MVSTLLTLLVVPAAYEIFNRWWGRRREAFETAYQEALSATAKPVATTP